MAFLSPFASERVPPSTRQDGIGPAPAHGRNLEPISPALPANTRVATVLGRGAAAFGRSREVAALALWTLALFFALALASYQGDPSGNPLATPTPPGADWVGPVGSIAARGLVSLVGIVAWGLPLELMLLGIPMVRGKESPATPGRIAGLSFPRTIGIPRSMSSS